jgi:hypothetical protein
MIRIGYVYIGGVEFADNGHRKWTPDAVDAFYLEMYELTKKAHPANADPLPTIPPPNKWYPMNILGLSKYSITRHGICKNNKKKSPYPDGDVLLKGSVHKRGQKRRFTMTDDDGKRVDPYVNQLVAKMFLPPPSKPSCRKIKHLNGDTLDCSADNLCWVCDSPEKQATVKMSAKSIVLKDECPKPRPDKYTEFTYVSKFGIQAPPKLNASTVVKKNIPSESHRVPLIKIEVRNNLDFPALIKNDVASVVQRFKQSEAVSIKVDPWHQIEFNQEEEDNRLEKSIHHGYSSSDEDDECKQMAKFYAEEERNNRFNA